MTVEIPGYRIVETLGKGGMATVYLAIQNIFERQVALKVMSTALAEDPSFGQRFIREARIVSQLVHPNIITVYDVGVHNQAYYLSMEYIDGPDLKRARDQLSLSQKIQILLDIAKALDFAGKKGYVHRDIKPENILLRSGSLSAVLMDFGIARTAESDLSVTQTGVALGTPHYMSPEQAKGLAVDHRSDLYSLGVVFYYLLRGEVPYHADSAVAIAVKHLTEPVPSLPDSLKPLQRFIDRLMAKDASVRYQSAAELIEDLSRLDRNVMIGCEQAEQLRKRTENVIPTASPSERAAQASAATVIDLPATSVTGSASAALESPSLLQKIQSNKVKGLLWEYKIFGVSAVLVLIAAGVIVRNPVEELSSPIIAEQTPKEQTSKELAFHKQASTEQAPKSLHDTSTNANEPKMEILTLFSPDDKDEESALPLRKEKPITKIQLADLGEQAYRKVSEPSSVSNPTDLVYRLQRRLQDATGRTPVREMTLQERVNELRASLAGDPRNISVERRLAELAANYFKKANSFFSSGDFVSAQHALEEGKQLFPEYQGLHKSLADRLKERSRLEKLLAQGDQYFEQGNWVSPWRRNAARFYQNALEIDRELSVAQQGLMKVEQALLEQAQLRYAEDNLREAESLAQEVLKLRPDHVEAKQFLLSVQQRKTGSLSVQKTVQAAEVKNVQSVSLSTGETNVSASVNKADAVRLMESVPDVTAGPKIGQLRLDGKLVSGINARHLQSVPKPKTLFVSFEYEKFPGETKQLLVSVLDQRGRLIAELPVSVAGQRGLQRFRIEAPRQGFSTGEHEIRITLDGAPLVSSRFQFQ